MSRQKKYPPKVDPFAKREAQKYENPIPSREFIMDHLAKVGKPMTLQQIADLLKLDKEQMEALRRRLRAMERDGQLIRNRRKGYGVAKKMDLVRGRIIGHPDGYGFLVPDEGGTDLFLSQKEMRSLMHGDRALLNIIGVDNKGRREGALVEVLEHNTQEVVGRYFHKKGQNVAFVEPDNRRIPHNILIEESKNSCEAKQGQIVVVRLLLPPTKYNPPFGEVIEIIGDRRDPGMEINISIRAHELPHVWPDEVLTESAKFTKKIPETLLEDREDMRDIPFVTIDGKDARDFDDAVQCQPRGKGWLLRVAIADVSSYVDIGTAIDLEAQNRGNSVYFPNRVVPMLPTVLSNQLCSLKPNVDRLCLVCELAIDFYGRTRRTRFFKAVMRSAARLTYTEVAKVLEGDEKFFRHPHILPQIHDLYSLYQLLLNRRKKRGAIDFETVEPRFTFNRQQKIKQIVPMVRNDAHKLIEEMMLAANVATAEWLKKQKIPLLYRIHEGPTEEKLTALRSFLKELGLKIWGKNKPQAPHYARLLEKSHERLDYRLIQTVLLRSLQLAIYTLKDKGHFGLAYSTYTHFTSPIRRYPDLLVHRAIHHCLKGLPADEFSYTNNEMEILGEHCSMTERRADETTRDAISMLKCEYMQNKIGQEYDGIVTGVTAFGIFVELEGVFIDGLVHVTALKEDYYHFDPIGQRLRGESSGTTYRLSDRIRVKVVRVDLEEKKIDFELA
ncbi:ribonuclease R [Candidatus Parabeggiatoa sp. HSG14]|uniref:ribonuclease R n=1 Tax=Candidatus Parabeggiatoa sp. HSG14 TaxID=3055593 RepID=UPI0025A86173|nr:ribonuclease R [Thiotrichales bacterium HSG14]